MVARKAAAKKAAPVKAGRTREELIEAYEEFYTRARARGADTLIGDSKTVTPYVLGVDRGFDPPITIGRPESLSAQLRVDQTLRNGDFFGALAILTGNQLYRIADTFEAATGSASEAAKLLMGLVFAVVDHFNGPGASDVPGGSPAS